MYRLLLLSFDSANTSDQESRIQGRNTAGKSKVRLALASVQDDPNVFKRCPLYYFTYCRGDGNSPIVVWVSWGLSLFGHGGNASSL